MSDGKLVIPNPDLTSPPADPAVTQVKQLDPKNAQKQACPFSWLTGYQQVEGRPQLHQGKAVVPITTQIVPFNMVCVGKDCAIWSEKYKKCSLLAAAEAIADGVAAAPQIVAAFFGAKLAS